MSCLETSSILALIFSSCLGAFYQHCSYSNNLVSFVKIVHSTSCVEICIFKNASAVKCNIDKILILPSTNFWLEFQECMQFHKCHG